MASWEKYLNKIYSDPKHPGSFLGPEKLYQAVKKDGKFRIGRYRIRKWLESNSIYTFNRVAHKTFNRNGVNVAGIDSLWDSDLIDFSNYSVNNGGNRYILLAIDVFSRYVWLRKLKSKNSNEMVNAFKSIFDEGRKPVAVRTDKGSEFSNRIIGKFFRDSGVYHYCTHNEKQANYAERAIKTIKTRIFRYMKLNNKHKYVDVINSFTNSYNNSKHSSIGIEPSNVNKGNESEIRLDAYLLKHREPNVSKVKKHAKIEKFKYKIGDSVRISLLKEKFSREYDQKWSTEIFHIGSRFRRGQICLYRIKDISGESIDGSFYTKELQRVRVKQTDRYVIEKILKKKTGKVFVKWKGWPKKFNSWINANEIKNV